MQPEHKQPLIEKSEFDDKIVKNYRIIKPIGIVFCPISV